MDNRLRDLLDKAIEKGFPEFMQEEIELLSNPIVPKFGTILFFPKQIVYNEDYVANSTEEVLTGGLAHELSHLLRFRDRTMFERIGHHMGYILIPSCKKKVEHTADEEAIKRGFGYEIWQSRKNSVENLLTPKEVRRGLKYYYSPDELYNLWQIHENHTQ